VPIKAIKALKQVLLLNCDALMSFFAVNVKGDYITNMSHTNIPLCWGSFGIRGQYTPTVFDSRLFKSFGNDIFTIIRDQWMSMYTEESKSYKVLDEVCRFLLYDVVT
jgi:hypothetical protein